MGTVRCIYFDNKSLAAVAKADKMVRESAGALKFSTVISTALRQYMEAQRE